MNFQYLLDHWQELVGGFFVTIGLTALGIAMGFAAGIGLAYLSRVRFKPVAWALVAYVEFFRNTPFVGQVFFLFFVLPTVGVLIPQFWVGVLALSLYAAAFSSENFRSGFQAVPGALVAAGEALALKRRQVFWHIELPVGISIALPSLANTAIGVLKSSSVLLIIGMLDLMGVARYLISISFNTWELMLVVVVGYLVLVGIMSLGFRFLETKVFVGSSLQTT